jgi:hypothetical protein
MNPEEFLTHYSIGDGQIRIFRLDIQNNTAEIEITARRCKVEKEGKPLTLLDPCLLRITFQDLIEISLFDKFPSGGYFIHYGFCYDNHLVTGLSFNVHDSASYVHEKDNWVIKAKNISWKEVEG